MMIGQFVELCRRRGLKVNANRRKVIVRNGEEGLECEVHINLVHLEHVSEFKYLGSVFDKAGTDGTEFSRTVAGTITAVVEARNLQIECANLA